MVTIGDTCTKQAHSYLKDKKYFPVIAVAITDPVKLGIMSNEQKPDGRFTAVRAEGPPHSIPTQVLLSLRKDIRRFAFVYREEKLRGRIRYEIEKMEEYLRSRNKPYYHLPISKGRDIEKLLSQEIAESDGAIVPYASMIAADLPPLEKICKEKGAILFAEAENVIPPGAICGLSSDIEFMGRQAALYIIKLTIDKLPVSEVPVHKFENTSRLTINNNTAKEFGVQLYDNSGQLVDFNNNLNHLINVRLVYHVMQNMQSTFDVRLFEHLRKASKRNIADNLVCDPLFASGNVECDEFNEFVCEDVLLDNTPFVAVLGRRMARFLQKKMLEMNRFKHILVIAFADEYDENAQPEPADIKANNWPAAYRRMNVTLPSFDITTMIRLIVGLQPQVKKIGFMHSFDMTNIPPHIEAILGEAYHYCKDNGIGFVQAGSPHEPTFRKHLNKTIESCQALFTLPECITVPHSKVLAQECFAKARFVIGGDADRWYHFAGALRINLEHIIDTAWPSLLEAARDFTTPPALNIILDFHDAYAYVLNETWLQRHSIQIPEQLEAFVRVAILRNPAVDNDDWSGGDMTMDEILRKPKKRKVKAIEEDADGRPTDRGFIEIDERLFVYWGIIREAS
ncbi:MAG: ABC transporter substrate binding protein [Candidatus Dependentiae bacterium]